MISLYILPDQRRVNLLVLNKVWTFEILIFKKRSSYLAYHENMLALLSGDIYITFNPLPPLLKSVAPLLAALWIYAQFFLQIAILLFINYIAAVVNETCAQLFFS